MLFYLPHTSCQISGLFGSWPGLGRWVFGFGSVHQFRTWNRGRIGFGVWQSVRVRVRIFWPMQSSTLWLSSTRFRCTVSFLGLRCIVQVFWWNLKPEILTWLISENDEQSGLGEKTTSAVFPRSWAEFSNVLCSGRWKQHLHLRLRNVAGFDLFFLLFSSIISTITIILERGKYWNTQNRLHYSLEVGTIFVTFDVHVFWSCSIDGSLALITYSLQVSVQLIGGFHPLIHWFEMSVEKHRPLFVLRSTQTGLHES